MSVADCFPGHKLAPVDPDELVRVTVDAWNRNDVEAWIPTLDPGVTYHVSGVFPGLQPSYTGHDGIREFWRTMHEPWEELRIDLDHVEQLGADALVVEFRFRAKGAESGASVDLRFSNSARIRDGLVTELFAAPTSEEALAKLRASAA